MNFPEGVKNRAKIKSKPYMYHKGKCQNDFNAQIVIHFLNKGL